MLSCELIVSLMNRRSVVVLLTVLLTLCLQTQVYTQCSDATCNELELVLDGNDAQLFCNLDSLECLEFSQDPIAFTDFPSFDFTEVCGGTIENPTWFSFVAWTPLAEITVCYADCESGGPIGTEYGVQAFIFDEPENWDPRNTALAFNCDCAEPYETSGINTFDIVSDSLNIGQQYWVMVDGCAGNMCLDVSLSFTNLPDTDPNGNIPLAEITRDSLSNPFCADQRVCIDTDFEITWPEHEELGGLVYLLTIFDESLTSIESMALDSSFFEWTTPIPGDYTYEVSFSNVCNETMPPYIGAFTVDAPDTIVYPPDTLCVEDITDYIGWPSSWLAQGCSPGVIPSVELYECSYVDSCNCSIVEQKNVHVIANLGSIPEVDTILCPDDSFDFFFHGNFITGEIPNGQLHSVVGGTQDFGCDSLINISVYAPNVDASIAIVDCNGLDVTYEVTIDDFSTYLDPNAIQISWFEDDSQVATGTQYTTSIDSLVSVEVTWSYVTSLSSADCEMELVTDTTYLTSSLSDYVYPEVSCNFSNDTVFYDFSFIPDGTSLVQITQLTSYTNYWDDDTWVFPGITSIDEVSILLSASDGNCSVPDFGPIECSTSCTQYTIDLPQDSRELCLLTGTIPIVLEANVTPSPSPLSTISWVDENGATISLPFLPVDDIDSTYTFIYQIQDPGCDLQTMEMEQTFYFPKGLQILNDEVTLCEGGLINTDTIVAPEAGVNWTMMGGTGVELNIIDQIDDDFIFTIDEVGTHTVFINAGSPGCPSSILTSFTVIVEEELDFTMRCLDQNFPIQFTWDNLGCIDSYDIYLDGDFVRNQTNGTFTPLGIEEGLDINIEIVPIYSCACDYDPIELSCNTGNCPPRETELIFTDTLFCLDDVPATLTNTVSLVVNGASNTETVDISTDIGTTEYYVAIQTANQCIYQDTFSVTVVGAPPGSIEGYGSDCYDNVQGGVTLNFDISLFEPDVFIEGVLYQLDELESVPFNPGNYFAQLTSNDNCPVNTFFTVPDAPSDFSIGVSGSDIVDEGTSHTYTLDSNVTDYDRIEWYVDGVLECTDTFECELASMGEGPDTLLITVYIYTADDCFKTTDYEIIINEPIIIDPPPPPDPLEDIFVSNIFMPNSSELWLIGANVPMEVPLVQVFDRWGNLVYTQKDILVEGEYTLWDGTYGGNDCEVGVYVYMIQYLDELGEEHKLVGDITLIR